MVGETVSKSFELVFGVAGAKNSLEVERGSGDGADFTGLFFGDAPRSITS